MATKQERRLVVKVALLLIGIVALGTFLFGDFGGGVKTFRIFEEAFKVTRGAILLLAVLLVGFFLYREVKKEMRRRETA